MSIFAGPELSNALPDCNLNVSTLKKVYQIMKNNGDSIAMVEGWSGREMSFKELLQQSCGVAHGLREIGVTKGDYVLLCCEKSVTAFSFLLGTQFTGATAVLYPPPHADCVPKLVHGHVIKAVFCDSQHFNVLSKSVAELEGQPLLMVEIPPNNKGLGPQFQPRVECEVFSVKDPRHHVCCIVFSSGTTGDPKGIQITDACLQFLGYTFNCKQRRLLSGSPFHWLTTEIFLMSSIFWRYTIILNNSNLPTANLKLIESYQVDGWFTGSGTMTKYVNELKLGDFNLTSLKRVFAGGEPNLSCVTKDFHSKVLGGHIPMDIIYGCSETGIASIFSTDDRSNNLVAGVGGLPYAGVEMKIVDETGVVKPVGCLGEVCVKTPARTAGYWARPDLDLEAFDNEGFFRTGDAGFFDDQGILYLRGRYSDLLQFRDKKISAIDCEDILMSHPAVFDVAVVGRPHPTDNQHLTAFVVKIPGCDVTEQQLQQLVDSKVKDHLRLRGGVHFIEALPRTIIGKVQRKLLREMPIKNM